MNVRRVALGSLTVFAAVLVGCGSEDKGSSSGNNSSSSSSSSGGSSSGDTKRTGVTECGGQSCQAGTYCFNLICEEGCGSDSNCADNQSCEKASGEAVGSCRNNAAAKDCAGWVKKCTTCGQTEAECTRACDVVSGECIECTKKTSGCELDACDSVCGG